MLSESLLNVYFPRELSMLIIELAKVTDTEKLAWLFQQSDDVIKKLTRCSWIPMEVQIDDGDYPCVLLVCHLAHPRTTGSLHEERPQNGVQATLKESIQTQKLKRTVG